MSEQKQWRVVGYLSGAEGRYAVQDSDGNLVAFVEQEGDARLIAQAPAMAEAIKKCLHEIRSYCDEFPDDWSPQYLEAHQVALGFVEEHFNPILDAIEGGEGSDG